MKSQILSFSLFAVFAVILVSAFASAALTLTPTSVPASVRHDAGNIVLQFNLMGSATNEAGLEWTRSITSPSGAQWTILPTATSVNAGQTTQVSAVLNIPRYSSGNVVGTLTVTADSGAIATYNVNIPIETTNSLTLSKILEITRTQNGQMKVDNSGNSQLSNIALSSSGAFPITFSESNFALSAGTSKSITLTPVSLTGLKFGTNTVTIEARDTNTNAVGSLAVNLISGFCKSGEAGGNLSIDRVKVSNSGTDDLIWKPLNKVEIEVKIANNNLDHSIKDVNIQMGLFDSSGRNRISDLNFDNTDQEKISIGSISKDSTDTETFSFTVPADLESGDYKLAIKAYSNNLKEQNECTDTSSDLDKNFYSGISVEKESDKSKFIAFDNNVLNPDRVSCGDTINLATEVFNIGDADQDQVKVTLFNTELGIKQSYEIRNNLNQGDKQKVSFNFQIPPNAQNKVYQLELTADYDYRSSNSEYRQSLGDSTKVGLTVIGCTGTTGTGSTSGTSTGTGSTTGTTSSSSRALISEGTASTPEAGKAFTATVKVTNSGTSADSFIVDASGYDSWATLDSITGRLVTLQAGESKDVKFNFVVNNDASGSNSFDMKVLSAKDSSVVASQSVEVPAIKSSSSSFSFNLSQGNTLIWVIGAINVVLILLIIIVAVRISRR